MAWSTIAHSKGNKLSDVIIGLLVDRSGSMFGIWDDAVGGANGFIEEQSDVEGRAFLFLSVFDTEYVRVVSGDLINNVKNPLVGVAPRGATALRDATAKLIQDIEREQRYAQYAPQDVVVAVMTDGYENASKEWTNESLTQLIRRKEQDGWKFIYLGANQDAWATGTSLGFSSDSTFNWAATSEGSRAAYSNLSGSIRSYRETGDATQLENAGRS